MIFKKIWERFYQWILSLAVEMVCSALSEDHITEDQRTRIETFLQYYTDIPEVDVVPQDVLQYTYDLTLEFMSQYPTASQEKLMDWLYLGVITEFPALASNLTFESFSKIFEPQIQSIYNTLKEEEG